MHRNPIRALLFVLTTAYLPHGALAADVTRYFESSASAQPRGDAGLSVAGARMRWAADVALRAPNGATQIRPKLSSTLMLGPRIGLETRIQLPGWSSSGKPIDANFDTKLRVQAPAPFLDELEGRVWRSRDGQTGRVLKLGFYQRLRATSLDGPITIRGRATLETASAGTAGLAPLVQPSRRMGLETEIGGLIPSFAAGRNALRLSIVRHGGVEAATARSLAYDHAWSFRNVAEVAVRLGLEQPTRRLTQAFEPMIGISWRGKL